MSSLIIEICKVKEVRNHPNADRLDLVTIKGWQVVAGRDEYRPGDLVVYIPPDSILPPDLIEKWKINYLKNNAGRVGVIKLRGEYSYGLVVDNYDNFREGQDVAAHYGITKWEPYEPPQRGAKKGRSRKGKDINPYFFRYTDIENIRNFPDILEEGEEVVIHEKIHGTNFRVGFVPKKLGGLGRLFWKLLGIEPYEFVVGSHNVQLNTICKTHDYYGQNIYMLIAERLNLKNKLKGFPNYIIYGEIFGQNIQDLTYNIKGIDVRFYDVMEDGRYLDYDIAKIVLEQLGLEAVPLAFRGHWLKELIPYCFLEKSALDEGTMKEGIVIKPVHERNHPALGRVILKALNPEYLTRKSGTENK